MKLQIYIIILTLLSTLNIEAQTKEAKKIEAMNWMTEQYPPYNYRDNRDGRVKGIAVDILMEMFKRIGVKKAPEDLEILPWPRSYKYLLERPNTVLFSTTYTMERLQHFKFVGPIVPTQVSIIVKKDRNIKVHTVEELNKLRIGVVTDDVGEQLILSLGVHTQAIHKNNTALGLVQMLDRGRLDAIAYAEDVARYQFGLAGLDPNDYESAYLLSKSHIGYAFHKTTTPQTLEPLRKALDELRTNGTVDSIYTHYLQGNSN